MLDCVLRVTISRLSDLSKHRQKLAKYVARLGANRLAMLWVAGSYLLIVFETVVVSFHFST